MASPVQPTLFLAKLLGLFMLLVGLAMLMQRSAMPATAMMLAHDAPLLLLFAMLTVAAGLAVILNHNIWSGGALPVVVTLCGWIALIKGLVLLLLSPQQAADLIVQMHYGQWFYFYAALPLALGAFLTWAGFKYPQPKARKR